MTFLCNARHPLQVRCTSVAVISWEQDPGKKGAQCVKKIKKNKKTQTDFLPPELFHKNVDMKFSERNSFLE